MMSPTAGGTAFRVGFVGELKSGVLRLGDRRKAPRERRTGHLQEVTLELGTTEQLN
jgi:hypothetical protein